MTTKTTSQTQQNKDAFAFNPTAGLEAWTKMTESYVQRMQSFHEELAKVQTQAVGQARDVIDQAATLLKDSVDYTARAQDELRKMAVDATRRATDVLNHRS